MSTLFTRLPLRGVTLANRLVVAPMCTYTAEDGMASDFHLIHLGRFALGGFGTVMVEATAVLPEGRITHGDLGLWSDAHVPGLRRIASALRENGAVPAIQLAHAGRKASSQRPWEGDGPLQFGRKDEPWATQSASEEPYAEGWTRPEALDGPGLERIKAAFVAATHRALDAGFDIIELHCAHGYLLNSFLSPLSNNRMDSYGGDLEARMRYPLEIAGAMREVIPADKPMFVRTSAVDGVAGGTTVEDTVAFARALKEVGVDLVDCSSGGISPRYDVPAAYGFQAPFAARVRNEAEIATMAVGLIVDPRQAESILQHGGADLIAVGREALADPDFPLLAAKKLGAVDEGEPFAHYPVQAGWWLHNRQRTLARLGAYENTSGDLT